MAIGLSSGRLGPRPFNCFDFSNGLLYLLLKKKTTTTIRSCVPAGGSQMKGMKRERGGIHHENKAWNIKTSHHKKWCMLWEPGKNWNWKPPKCRVYSNRSCSKHEEGLSIKATGWSDRLGVDASSWWPQLPNLFELGICKSRNKGGLEEIKVDNDDPFQTSKKTVEAWIKRNWSRILLDFMKSLITARDDSAGNKRVRAKFCCHEGHPTSQVYFAISFYCLLILATIWRLFKLRRTLNVR